MMMVSDDCLVECKIDDDDDDEEQRPEERLPPPPEFASKEQTPSTPTPKPPTPPTVLSTPTCTPPPPVNRDPYGFNRHLKVEVSDVLAEPAFPQSMDTVWRYSVCGFEKTRVWTYCCLSSLLAIPFALLCGIFLGILACLHVWYCCQKQ